MKFKVVVLQIRHMCFHNITFTLLVEEEGLIALSPQDSTDKRFHVKHPFERLYQRL